VTTLLQHVDRWRSSGLLGQMIRFGIAGGLSTLVYSAVYLPLTL
jgi:putative flippase GtrA